MKPMQHLDELNSPQKEAVLHTEGPILIVAGAGAGKTRVITHRIIHLIKSGVSPEEILAITFTNKAAREMLERVEALLGNDSVVRASYGHKGRPFMSTFHSLSAYILREHGNRIGLKKHFSILNRSETLSFTKQAIKAEGLDPKQFEPARLHSNISRLKGDLITQELHAQDAGNGYFPKALSGVWKRYEKLLSEHSSLDFDDLILKTVLLLRDYEDVRKYYQEKWKYIHVDEYQDTNVSQYELTHMLSKPQNNLCVVGDGDQNIYSWRGADIKNILNFEKDYPDAKVVLLEENYRSTQTILTAANDIIKKNKARVEKNLFTKNAGGSPITVYSAYDETDEATFIAEESNRLIKEGVSPRRIAVLYRANFQSRVLEEAFLSRKIPYQVLGVRFFDRKEVKDVISFLKASINRDSLGDIKRVINVPPRGIGKVTLIKIFAGQETTLPPKMQEKVSSFWKLLDSIQEKTLTTSLAEVIKHILKESGLQHQLSRGTDDEKERLENLMELVTLASKYDVSEPEEAINAFLSDVALATDQDTLEKDTDAVKLMTIHASKGLEFKYVFISGLEQDLFPHRNYNPTSGGEEHDEEERRLFYVAITRAEKKLFLTHASVRTIFGSKQVNMPSEFLSDIDEALLEHKESEVGSGDLLESIFFD